MTTPRYEASMIYMRRRQSHDFTRAQIEADFGPEGARAFDDLQSRKRLAPAGRGVWRYESIKTKEKIG
jgi:hypothetical protein